MMRLALMLLLLVPFPATAQQADARLNVELGEETVMQGAPDTNALLDEALPVLWDRIVPVANRASADGLGRDSRMVARIIPGRATTLVEFHGERVFEVLREAHIPAIVTAPRFHLLISVRNVPGQEMQQTGQLLVQEAEHFARLHGIELSDGGAGLVLSWHWLDATHAELSVRGQTRLAEFVETREITDADSLPALQAWLDEVLLRARDAYAFVPGTPVDDGMTGMTADDFRVHITVRRSGSLLEQVALEDSLARDPRVRRLLPETLSITMQRYALKLEGGDTSWLGEWFARRGYRLDRLADGSWVAQ